MIALQPQALKALNDHVVLLRKAALVYTMIANLAQVNRPRSPGFRDVSRSRQKDAWHDMRDFQKYISRRGGMLTFDIPAAPKVGTSRLEWAQAMLDIEIAIYGHLEEVDAIVDTIDPGTEDFIDDYLIPHQKRIAKLGDVVGLFAEAADDVGAQLEIDHHFGKWDI